VTAVLQRQTCDYVQGEYDELSGTFTNACRECDRAFRKQQSSHPSGKPDGPAKSTLDAIDYLLSEKDEARLRLFLEGRSNEAEKLLAYIERKTS
jgi:hypothetical protein